MVFLCRSRRSQVVPLPADFIELVGTKLHTIEYHYQPLCARVALAGGAG